MYIDTCQGRGFMGAPRVSGERPIGAGSFRQQSSQAPCPPPPPCHLHPPALLDRAVIRDPCFFFFSGPQFPAVDCLWSWRWRGNWGLV